MQRIFGLSFKADLVADGRDGVIVHGKLMEGKKWIATVFNEGHGGATEFTPHIPMNEWNAIVERVTDGYRALCVGIKGRVLEPMGLLVDDLMNADEVSEKCRAYAKQKRLRGNKLIAYAKKDEFGGAWLDYILSNDPEKDAKKIQDANFSLNVVGVFPIGKIDIEAWAAA